MSTILDNVSTSLLTALDTIKQAISSLDDQASTNRKQMRELVAQHREIADTQNKLFTILCTVNDGMFTVAEDLKKSTEHTEFDLDNLDDLSDEAFEEYYYCDDEDEVEVDEEDFADEEEDDDDDEYIEDEEEEEDE